MGPIVAAIVGLLLAGLTTFGLVTMTTNASAPGADQPSDGNVVIYGSSN